MPVRVAYPAAAAAALLFLGACAAKVERTANPAGQTVTVELTPASVELVEGQALQFTVQVTGTANTTVSWQVDEPGGGTVDASGMYAAPAGAGTFHVRAVSAADGSVAAVATVTVRAAAPGGAVAITPKAVSVVAGATTAFSAVLSNLSSNAVTWRVQETSGCGSVSSIGVYTAPSAAGTCHVVVASAEDPSLTDVATVTVSAAPVVTVSLDAATLTMDACTTRTFTARVSGSTDQRVSWTADGGAVTSGGAYTAPSTPGVYHVVVTALASGATARATVTVREHVLSVTLDPPSASVAPGAAQQFTATVTTTCGAFTTG